MLFAGALLRAQQHSIALIQPTRDASGVVLFSRTGDARLEIAGGAGKALPVRKNETLSRIEADASGWLIAGTIDRPSRREIVLIEVDRSHSRRVDAPDKQTDPFRLNPNLLADRRQVQGMAWLEGPDMKSLSVRLALHDDYDWSDPVVIPRPTRGSQTGLSGTVLEDGSWLLVWVGHDGSDDDLFFSRLVGDSIAQPRRVTPNNSVADVMPSVMATEQGALLAWSRETDGEYRIHVSRFEGGHWTDAKTIGPAGSIEPSLAYEVDRARISYREAWPRRWTVAELDSLGRPTRRVEVEAQNEHRPAVENSSGDRLELVWSTGQRSEAIWEPVP